MEKIKTCRKCGKIKHLVGFNRHPHTKDGFHGTCKDCRNKRTRELSAERKDDPAYIQKRRERDRIWYRNNPEKVKAKRRRLYTTERGRKWNRKCVYGLSEAGYAAMLSNQSGKCAICGSSGKRLVIDHDHRTEKIRGLLCYKCNTLAGLWENVVEVSERLKSYLEDPPAFKLHL